jgi:hypothetical protein
MGVLQQCDEHAPTDRVADGRPEEEEEERTGTVAEENTPNSVSTRPAMEWCRDMRPMAPVTATTMTSWLMVSRAATTSHDSRPISQPACDGAQRVDPPGVPGQWLGDGRERLGVNDPEFGRHHVAETGEAGCAHHVAQPHETPHPRERDGPDLPRQDLEDGHGGVLCEQLRAAEATKRKPIE